MTLAERTIRVSDSNKRSTVCVSVLIASSDEVLRQGLRATLDDSATVRIVGSAANGLAAITSAARRRPDVALIHLQLTAPGGIETAAIIARRSPHCRVVLYLDNNEPRIVRRALAAGVAGYLLKGASQDAVRQAVHRVSAGGDYVDPQLAEAMREATESPLSDRETAVLALVSNGMTNGTVALELEISEETVKSHVKSILGKLQADCRTHAVAIGLRSGLIC